MWKILRVYTLRGISILSPLYREQWKGNVPPYHPIFMDGWSPDYPVSDNRGSTSSEQVPLSGDKRGRDEPRSHREVKIRKTIRYEKITSLQFRAIIPGSLGTARGSI